MIVVPVFAAMSLVLGCSPPAGTDAVLASDHRYIVIGERHGSVETPAAFGQIVCSAAERGPVTVALELPQGMQPQIDAFLAALDHALALAALAGTPLVDPGVVDGRTSQAMFAMLDTLRQLKADGRDIVILAFQPSDPSPPELSQAWYELDMAYWLSRAVVERPQAKVIALVGSIHASKTAVSGLTHIGLPATAHLPPGEVLSLVVANQGGQTWSCRKGCGVHDSPGGHDQDARGIVLEPTADGAFDGTIALGPAHASPPFVTVLTLPVMQGH